MSKLKDTVRGQWFIRIKSRRRDSYKPSENDSDWNAHHSIVIQLSLNNKKKGMANGSWSEMQAS